MFFRLKKSGKRTYIQVVKNKRVDGAVRQSVIESRCNRQLGRRFGDQAYAIEELVAELGASFLCADLGIADESRADHAQYLSSWLSVLKADKKAIFTAASKASEAVAFLTGLQGA